MSEQAKSGHRCPQCGAGIALEDVNVAKDIALCRECGRTMTFSEVMGAEEVPMEVPLTPPRWVRMDDGFSGEKTIAYRRPSPALFFMVPFLCLWSGLSMWGIYFRPLMTGTFTWSSGLFGLPFLIGTLVLLGITAYMAFGKWVVTLSGGTGTVFVGLGPLGWTREFAYGRETVVSKCMTKIQVNNVTQSGIKVKTGETEFVFGSMMTEVAKDYISAVIRHEARGRL